MEYNVSISWYDSGLKQTVSFYKRAATLDELKSSFLKRFGNIREAPNKALAEKPRVKELTKQATTLSDWVQTIRTHTRWELNIYII